jgi:hypothetical protein
MSDSLMTPECRLSFPHLFKPQKVNENSEPKYSVSLLFPKGTDLSQFKQAAEQVAREKWNGKIPKKIRLPFLDQGDYEYEGYEEGAVLIRASSKLRPGVVDQKVQPILDESDVYPGCYVRATLRAFAYDVNGNRGVSFGLQNLQKLREGESLGGKTRAEDDFQPVADADINAESSDSLFD